MPDLPDSSDLITFGMRDENAPHSWNNAPLNSLLKNGKELFVLGGNGNQWSRDGNAMTKVGISFLGDDYKKFNVFGAYYRNGTNKTPYVAMRSMFLIDNILVPQIATKDKFGNLHRLPFEEAWRNMRKKVFLTHCHGGRIMREATKQINNIHSRLDEIMLSIGYSEKEAEVIHRQMVVFHQNNPCADIGTGPTRSIEFYRITQADEQNRPVVYNTDSFGYYLATEQMAEHDIYYAALSENERAFIIPKISPYKKSEHNGAYWQVPREEKYESAQIEEDMFLAFFKEITSTDYMIENMSQIEENVMKKNPHLRQTFKEMQDDGDDFMENYRGYRQNVQEEFNEAKEKLLQGKFSSADGAEISQEALFMHDANGHNLLDLAVQQKNASMVELIWKNMLEVMPAFEHGKDLKKIYENCSSDMLETKEKHRFYTMQALENNDEKMFSALVQNSDVLVGLDYAQAGTETALCAAEKFCSFDWHDENMSLPAMELVYGSSLKALMKRCGENDIPKEKSESFVNRLMQKHRLYIKREKNFVTSILQDLSSGRGY